MQSGCSVQRQLLRFGGKLNQFTRPYLTYLITHITFLVVLTVLSSDFFLQVELHGSLIQHFIKCSVWLKLVKVHSPVGGIALQIFNDDFPSLTD